jgi:hypothetical protein
MIRAGTQLRSVPLVPGIGLHLAGDPVSLWRRTELRSGRTGLDPPYQQVTGRQLSADRIMAWHLRQALGDVLWRSELGIGLGDRRTPPEWIEDLAARFSALGIDPDPRTARAVTTGGNQGPRAGSAGFAALVHPH